MDKSKTSSSILTELSLLSGKRKNSGKRCRYKCHSKETKQRVVNAYIEGKDWVELAHSLDVKVFTARVWIKQFNSGQEPRPHGGARRQSLTDNHVEDMLAWIKQDASLTLRMLRIRLFSDFGIDVSLRTVSNYLDGRLFTMRGLDITEESINSKEVKEQRHNFVMHLLSARTRNKTILWFAETTCKLYCGRTQQQIRACSVLTDSRGQTLHIITAISESGVVEFEMKRGVYTNDRCRDWFERLVVNASKNEECNRLVFVCDRASCHSNLEEVLLQERFQGAELLRLPPCSQQLNPFEAVWTTFETELKSQMTLCHKDLLMGDPQGLVDKYEYRLQLLEQKALATKAKLLTPEYCGEAVSLVFLNCGKIVNCSDT